MSYASWSSFYPQQESRAYFPMLEDDFLDPIADSHNDMISDYHYGRSKACKKAYRDGFINGYRLGMIRSRRPQYRYPWMLEHNPGDIECEYEHDDYDE